MKRMIALSAVFIFILVVSCKESKSSKEADTNSSTGKINAAYLESPEVYKVVDLNDGLSNYYIELLEKSFKAIGEKITIIKQPDIPQARILESLKSGRITLHWFVDNEEKNTTFVPIEIGITNSLIGHRILFIPKGSQNVYDGIKTLDDFKNLGKIGGFGKNWFDIRVWQANGLPYIEQTGEWRNLYKMVESETRGVDYFSRGAQEMVQERDIYPFLDVEKKLCLVYNRDFRFYLSPSFKEKKTVLYKAIDNAKRTGIIDDLIRKYYSDVFDKDGINLDGRIKINLKLPE